MYNNARLRWSYLPVSPKSLNQQHSKSFCRVHRPRPIDMKELQSNLQVSVEREKFRWLTTHIYNAVDMEASKLIRMPKICYWEQGPGGVPMWRDVVRGGINRKERLTERTLKCLYSETFCAHIWQLSAEDATWLSSQIRRMCCNWPFLEVCECVHRLFHYISISMSAQQAFPFDLYHLLALLRIQKWLFRKTLDQIR